MHTTYCLTHIFAGFRTKRIELTFLECPTHEDLLTPAEQANTKGVTRACLKLLRRAQGYVLALENVLENADYYPGDVDALLTFLVEELVACSVTAGVRAINNSQVPVFQYRSERPEAQPECISSRIPTIVQGRWWNSLENLARDLFYGRVCCLRYTIRDVPSQMDRRSSLG